MSEPGVRLTQTLLSYWPVALGVFFVAYLVRSYFNNGLNRYPGPLLAKFTDAWRVYDVYRGRPEQTLIDLHRKYGPVVRIGPNTVDISHPELVPVIYGLHKGFDKTAFYNAFKTYSQGRLMTSLFMMRDERVHTASKRPVGGMYSLATLTNYEPLVDDMVRLFVERATAEFSDPARPCDMGQWMHFMALDLILHLTFGSSPGFLEHGADVDGFMAMQLVSFGQVAPITQMPWLRYLQRQNPIMRLTKGDSNFGPKFVRPQVGEHQRRLAQSQATKVRDKPAEDGSDIGEYGDDFLTRFLQHPQLSVPDAISYCMVNVFAGADSTAITLRAIVYFLLKHPAPLQRLLAELRAGALSYPVTWKESQQLPYLHAVVHEALRLFPAFGLSLERAVPAAGLELPDGTHLPPGTQVGMNAWVVHRSEDIYGADVDAFRPERWLRGDGEDEAVFERRLAAMKRTDLAFGFSGSKRVCLGRNISYLEIYKLIPTLFLEFDVELVEPEREWETRNTVFVHQWGMDCWLKRRVR